MPKPAVAIPFILILILVLAGCGSSSHSTLCPSSASATCTCGPCPVQSVSYVYASGLNGQVAAYPVDAATGALGTPSTTSGPSASFGIATINNTFLYASDSESSGSIDAWTIDQSTGELSSIAGSPFALGAFALPTGLAATDNVGPFLYVADVAKIDAFEAGTMGMLSAVPGSPFAAGINLYLALDPQDRFLFAANDGPPASVLGFSIDQSTGALTPVPGASFPITSNQTSPMQLGQVAVDASGKFVYVVLTFSNEVLAFSIASNGALTPVPGSPFAAGITPLSMTTTKNFVYVSNAAGISGFSIDGSSGVLTPLAGSPFAIHATPIITDTGASYLYGSSAAGMLSFRIDPSTGALTQIGSTTPFTKATVLAYVQ
jgi:6-phosphogluconolactonase